MFSSAFGNNVNTFAPGVSIGDPPKKKKNKNNAFPSDTSSYAPGVSVGAPTDVNEFLDDFANKRGRISRKDMKAFEKAGGDLGELRSAYEDGRFKLNAGMEQRLQNATSDMANVPTKASGRPSTRGFMDEFANARGRVTRSDMKAFEEAGGNLTGLEKKLSKGYDTLGEIRESGDDSILRPSGAVRFGNDDYFTGEKGMAFLKKKLAEKTAKDAGTAPGGEDGIDPGTGIGVGAPNTPDAGLDLSLKVEYPDDLEASSGFPFNPGRQTGEPFTDYQDRIPEIKEATDERLEEKGVYDRRTTAEDTATQSYFNQLIDGGILPGSPGYVSAAEKNAERGADPYDPNDPDLIASRQGVLENKLAALQANKEIRDTDRSERHWGEGGTYSQAMAELNKNLKGREDIFEPYPSAPIDQRTPKEKEKGNAKLPNLPDKPKGGMVKGPGLFETKTITTEGKKPPDDFKKKPSFDGTKDFDTFLARARMGGDASKLYNALRDAGLSNDEMYKGAQYAGITNLRTSDKSIKDDIKAIQHAVDNDYYEGWDGKGETRKVEKLKSEKDLYNWYRGEGGDDKLNKLIRQAGYSKYNSEGDANKLVDAMQNSLRKDGIRAKVPEKDLKAFNKEMDAIAAMFGGKYRWSSYQEALKKGDASKVNDWVKNYIDLGGGVGQRVTDAMKDQG